MVRALIFVFASLCGFAALAQSPIAPESSRDPLAPVMFVLEAVPAGVTVEQIVLRNRAEFKRFDEHKKYQQGKGTVVWLYGRRDTANAEAVSQAPQRLTLADASVNQIDFFVQNAQGQWQQQAAGRQIPQKRWPVPGLYPRFDLPANAPEFYVRVQQHFLLPIPIKITSQVASEREMQAAFLQAGLLMAFMAAIAGVSLVMALVYRDLRYLWHSLSAVLATMGAANLVGLGSMFVWSSNPSGWADAAVGTFMAACMVAQLNFCVAFFLRGPRFRLSRRYGRLSIAVGCALVVAALLQDDPQSRGPLFLVILVFSAGCIFTTVALARKQHPSSTKLWLLAYLPVISVVGLKMLHRVAGMEGQEAPNALLYFALIFEMVVLLVTLQLHAKSEVSERAEQEIKDKFDPLLQVLSVKYFLPTLQKICADAALDGVDVGIAYVRAVGQVEKRFASSFPGITPRKLAAAVDSSGSTSSALVRLLRIVARPQDTVAHAGAGAFALIMPGTATASELNQRLSRLVVLGMQEDSTGASGGSNGSRLRIAVTTRHGFSGSLDELHGRLLHRLHSQSQNSPGPIQFLGD